MSANPITFGEALDIVLALAVAARATAETGKNVTEERIDEAIELVTARAKSLQVLGKKPGVRPI